MTFSMSMLWAQIFPFVALSFFEDKEDNNNDNNETKSNITTFLVCSFVA